MTWLFTQLTTDPESLTDDTEGLAGEFEPASPSSVAAAAAGCPDPHKVLHSKHHNGHDFLYAHGTERDSS